MKNGQNKKTNKEMKKLQNNEEVKKLQMDK